MKKSVSRDVPEFVVASHDTLPNLWVLPSFLSPLKAILKPKPTPAEPVELVWSNNVLDTLVVSETLLLIFFNAMPNL